MIANDTLRSLETLLEEERAAIRRLDASRVEEIAQKKEALVATLASLPVADRARVTEDLRSLRGTLQRNAILLAHARDLIRDATGPTRRLPGARFSRVG